MRSAASISSKGGLDSYTYWKGYPTRKPTRFIDWFKCLLICSYYTIGNAGASICTGFACGSRFALTQCSTLEGSSLRGICTYCVLVYMGVIDWLFI